MKINIAINCDNFSATKSKQWPQYLAVLTASISALACGLHFGWCSPSTPILLDPSYPINITTEDISNIAILQPIGDCIGAPLAMVCADVIGRKKGILLLGLPSFIAWMIIAYADSVLMFCVGRFISGIADGMLFIFYPMYVGEVTEPRVRGVLGCTLSVGMILGMLIINAFAPYVSIKTAAFISSSSSILLILTFIWMPESPYFLLMKEKKEEARKALTFLRRCDVTKDLELLEKDVKRQMSETGTFKDIITIDSNRKAILTMFGIRTMQQVSGAAAWGIFTQTVFIQSNSDLSPIMSTLIYLFLQMIVTGAGSFMVDKYGRKPLILISSFLCAITLSCGAIYFYLDEKTDYDLSSLNWMPLTIMLILVIVFGFGLGTAPTLMLGELFSASIKTKALCIMCIYYALMITLIVKLFNLLLPFGMYAPFALFGLCCFVNVIVGFWFVPETKGKTLEEIQQEFKGNKPIKKYMIRSYFSHAFPIVY